MLPPVVLAVEEVGDVVLAGLDEDKPSHSIHEVVPVVAVVRVVVVFAAAGDDDVPREEVAERARSISSARLYSSFCSCSARSISACNCAASNESLFPLCLVVVDDDAGVDARRRLPPTFDTAAEYERCSKRSAADAFCVLSISAMILTCSSYKACFSSSVRPSKRARIDIGSSSSCCCCGGGGKGGGSIVMDASMGGGRITLVI